MTSSSLRWPKVSMLLASAFAAGIAGSWFHAAVLTPQPQSAPAPVADLPRDRAAMVRATPWDGTERIAELEADGHADHLLTFPADTCYLRVDVEEEHGHDVDLFLADDPLAAARGEWRYSATGYDAFESLVLTRDHEPMLALRSIVVRVTNGESTPVRFRLEAVLGRAPEPQRIDVDSTTSGMVLEEHGFRSRFEVRVPDGCSALRFDLSNVGPDFDLCIAEHSAALDVADHPWVAATTVAAEHLILTAESMPPLRPGTTLFVTVFSPTFEHDEMPFRLSVTNGTKAPAQLLAHAPPLPVTDSPQQRAIAACVAIAAGDGTGSGMLVRPDGLILTAAHVVHEVADGAPGVVVAMTGDPRRFPVEMFRGVVEARDDDLDIALVQLEQNLYGGPLPTDLRLPSIDVEFEPNVQLGEPVSTVGYPGIGGAASRVTISWSRGALVGFDPDPVLGLQLKTDALIASGNSGGGLLDERLRLVGVTLSVIDEDDGNALLGYALSMDQLPTEWRRRIRDGRPRLDGR